MDALGRGRHLYAELCGGPLGAARQSDLAVQCSPPALAAMALVALAGIASEPEASVHAAARIVIAAWAACRRFLSRGPWRQAPALADAAELDRRRPEMLHAGTNVGPPARPPQVAWNRPAANP